jgi:hypothetical protein
VVREDRLRLIQELRAARRTVKLIEREIAEAEAVASGRLQRGLQLLGEAREAGIVDFLTVPDASSGVETLLRQAEAWQPTSLDVPEDDRIEALQNEIQQLRREQRARQERIEAAESFLGEAQGYASAATEHVRRLEPVAIFEGIDEKDRRCPLCSSHLTDDLPSIREIRRSLGSLRRDLDTVQREQPRLREYIDQLKEEREQIRLQIGDRQRILEGTLAEQSRQQQLHDAVARAAHVKGRISLYLENVGRISAQSRSRQDLAAAQREAARLTELVDPEESQQLLDSVLSRIGKRMTEWAERLALEHSGWPFRLDVRNLTVVADRPGRPIPMQRMGGGENWLGCHLIALLSLHQHFVEERRPVPSFLILDQPTQVYFPSTLAYRELAGSLEATEQSDADIVAVRRMFSLLFDVVEALSPEFQLIVLEHANLRDNRFQEALVEGPWTEGTALIPTEWYA